LFPLLPCRPQRIAAPARVARPPDKDKSEPPAATAAKTLSKLVRAGGGA
jgi:hypothetical protein